MDTAYQIALAYGIDLLAGDPRGYPHPVRIVGAAAAKLETATRKIFAGKTLAGAVTVLLVVGGAYALSWLLLALLARWSAAAAVVASIFLIYTTLSTRCLFDESRPVAKCLIENDLASARRNLAMIVGRDTGNLNEKEVIRATVETVAENTVDGIISPLFYACVGGAPLALAYKAVNTLDSMFGYRNERYMQFGCIPARLDDAANWIPARIAGPLIALASTLCGFDGIRAIKTVVRDGQNHSSPNAGISEAAVAGALGVQLGGTSFYSGQPVAKPTIGGKHRDLETADIARSHKIMFTASALAAAIFILTGELARR